MKRPPRSPDQSIFADGMATHILWVGILMGAVTIGTQVWAIQNGNPHWQTMTFTVLCFSQLGHVMAIRSGKESIFTFGFLSNKPLLITILITVLLQLIIIYSPFFRTVFKTQALTVFELIISLVASSIVFWAVEAEKWLKRKRSPSLVSAGQSIP
jgi:Ca2+-transporting ATPase